MTATEIQTSIGLLKMRQADLRDKFVHMEIMLDAASWLKSQGIDQWQSTFRGTFAAAMERRISSGFVYLASLGDEVVGTVRIEWEDVAYWGGKGNDALAGYIHGLAVPRKWAGKGLGREILGWACQQIQAKGKRARLDCMASNPKLCAYYESLGFTPAGDSVPSEHSPTKLYELVDPADFKVSPA